MTQDITSPGSPPWKVDRGIPEPGAETGSAKSNLMTLSTGHSLELQLQKPRKDVEKHLPSLLPPSRYPALTQQSQAMLLTEGWPTSTTRQVLPLRSHQNAPPQRTIPFHLRKWGALTLNHM